MFFDVGLLHKLEEDDCDVIKTERKRERENDIEKRMHTTKSRN